MIDSVKEEFVLGWHYKTYLMLMHKARREDRQKGLGIYYEQHHILPKCIFPEFKDLKKFPDNSVLLMPREHFIAHMLLPRFMKLKSHRIKMNRSLCKFCHQNYTPKLYHIEKTRISREGFSEEHRRKIGIASAKKNYTPEYRKKISDAGKGRVVSAETRKKYSDMNKGKRPSDNTIDAATKKHATPFSFTSPNGEIFTGTGLRQFCREHGLHQSAMNGVRAGIKPHYKQWRHVTQDAVDKCDKHYVESADDTDTNL